MLIFLKTKNMKKIIFLIAFIAFQLSSYGQLFYNNFESDWGMDVTIGSSPVDSFWQIGVPQKTNFDEAYSEPNAIVTHLELGYLPNLTSSFIVDINEDILWGFPFIQIEWQQKFDVEIGVDGGIVEASYDGGATWQNVLSDTIYRPFVVGNFQINPLFNGEVGFTGMSDWSFVGLCWGTPIGEHPDNIQGLKLRFTFVSDSNDTNQEGWMIDEFATLGGIIGASTDDNSRLEIEVYPNPTNGDLILKLPETNSENFALEISNNSGQTVLKENIRNRGLQNHQVSFESFSKGVYFLRLKIGDKIYRQRIIKI